MQGKDLESQIARLSEFQKGFFATHLIHIGAKLGLFEAFSRNPVGATISALSSQLKLHEPYLKIWCQTAYRFELLDCDEHGRYRLAPFLNDLLGDRSNLRNCLDAIDLAVEIAGNDFLDYPYYFRTGDAVKDICTDERTHAAVKLSKRMHLVFLHEINTSRSRLRQMLQGGIRYLDVGCGGADLIIQLAGAYPESRFVGVDPDARSIEIAEDSISRLGLEGRVTALNLKGEDLSYRGEFDIASMFVTFHEIRPPYREKVIQNVHGALKSGGQLLIVDFPYPNTIEDFRKPEYQAGILDQFFETHLGVVYLNSHERRELLAGAGFTNIEQTTLGKGMLELVTATR